MQPKPPTTVRQPAKQPPQSFRQRRRTVLALVEAGTMTKHEIAEKAGVSTWFVCRVATDAGLTVANGRDGKPPGTGRVAFWADRAVVDVISKLAREFGLSRSALAERVSAIVFQDVDVARRMLRAAGAAKRGDQRHEVPQAARAARPAVRAHR